MRRPDGSIETNDEEKAQMFAYNFQTVYTHENTLLEVGLPSRTENAIIQNVQVFCNDVKKDLKVLNNRQVHRTE